MKTIPLADALRRAHGLLPTPALAEQQAAAILRAVPGQPDALLVLGAARRRLGNPQAASAVLGPLARDQPCAAAVQAEWGLTQAQLGQIGPAVASLRRALSLNPALPGARRQLRELGTIADAPVDGVEAAGARAAVLLRASDAMADDNLSAAEHMLRQHLGRSPDDAAALRMLAEIGLLMGRADAAIALLERCLAMKPEFDRARHELAIALLGQDQAEAALMHGEYLYAQEQRNLDYRNLLGACLALTGQAARAVDVYGRLLAEAPDWPKAWLSYGHVLRGVGRGGDACAAYRRAIGQAPRLGEAYWSLVDLDSGSVTAAEAAAMRVELARADTTVEDRLHLHYALGRVQKEAGAYTESFHHYAAGAALRRRQITYHSDHLTALVERSCALLTAAFFAERAGLGCQDAAPIFIVGLPRSGSTLVEQILASHSQVEGTLELPELGRMARGLGYDADAGSIDYPGSLARLEAADFARLGEQFIAQTRIYRRGGTPFFIDKMPENFMHIGLIQLILPRATIIDARRHPMAACFSAFKQHFAKGRHFSYDLAELGRFYRDYVALMAHFDSVLPGRIHRVLYETLVEDPEAGIRALLGGCGLAFEEACLRFHENVRAVGTASSEQVRRPISRDGLDHWRHYAAWLRPLQTGLEAS